MRARLLELFTADRPFLLLDAMKAKREREAIAYARAANYFTDVMDGDAKPTGEVRFKGFAALTDAEIAAIASVKQTKAGVEIKLHDKDASLRAIEARVDPLPGRTGKGADDDPDDNVPAEQVARWDEPPAAGVRAN